MRIVREQMLCIVSPDWMGGDVVPPLTASLLNDLFTQSEIIHFASLALLPNASSSSPSARPTLLFELAVDEGIKPREVLARLAHHPSGALWELYRTYFGAPPHLPAGPRNVWVLQKLLAGVHISDGGFVGPRDRTVVQIRQERDLYVQTRRHARTLPLSQRSDRALFAQALARWVYGGGQFAAETEPAPKSFWRMQSVGAKLAYLGILVAGGFAALWVLQWGFGVVESGTAYVFGAASGGAVFAHVKPYEISALLTCVLQAGLRLLKLLALLYAATLAFVIFSALAHKLVPWWGARFSACERELDRPSETWASRVCCAFGWLVLIALGVELVSAATYVFVGAEPLLEAAHWLSSERPAWLAALLGTYLSAFVLLLVVLGLCLQSSKASIPNPNDDWLQSRLKLWQRRFFQPFEDQVPRAQQVHPSIEKCEAALVGGTAHIVSLTDLRRPYWWSAFWTRLILRVVTAFGYAFFTEGRLGDAPGIQYSHWHIIGGRRLLFCANFDGTFGGYLDDFIKGPSIGTTLFWRWTHLVPRHAAAPDHPDVLQGRRFPPTRFLIFRGVKCEQRFKAYARESMLPHLYRYVGNELTLEQKNRNTALRDALCGERTDAKDDLIMRSLES